MTALGHELGMCLFCRVAARICAVPLEHVRETMRPMPVEPLPGAPHFVLGLSIIRGATVPVVHAAKLLGVSDVTWPSRFVVLETAGRQVALAVDSVIGIHQLSAVAAQDPPPLLREASPEVISAIGHLDAELLLVLRAASTVPEATWRDLEAGGAAQ